MKTSYRILISALTLTFIFSSCKEDPIGPSIFLIPGGIHIQAEADDLIEFDISARAGDNELRNLVITQKPEGGITTTLLDTMLQGNSADFFYVYEVPNGEDNILMSFAIYDSEGMEGSTGRRVFVTGNEFLIESTGHQIYSPYLEASPNAYDICENEPLVLSTLSDSSNVHLTELDSNDDDQLSLTFTSYAGNKFVRNNAFNYAEATHASAQNTYESSTALQAISNIQIDDILITKYDTINDLFAVIRITGAQDNVGLDSDRYTFNIKK